MWQWVLDFVVCPACRERLTPIEFSADGRDGLLTHQGGACAEVYPVIDGIPRLLVGSARGLLARQRADWFGASPFAQRLRHWSTGTTSDSRDLRLVERFDREWRSFSSVGSAEQGRIFARYFDLVPTQILAEGRLALDAGCGGGRWAYEVQRRGPRVVAVDLGRSIEVAERNTRETGRVACVQADVRDLPVRAGAFDLVYSLGVLHHVDPTERAVEGLARLLRPGGVLLLYLYYALDGRSASYRALFRAADTLRGASSALPQPLLVGLSTALAACVYLPLSRLARGLRAAGLPRAADSLPLSFYADLSFETMRNDSLDRFGTRLEKRYTRVEVRRLLEEAGLNDVEVSDRPPYWHAIGRTEAARR